MSDLVLRELMQELSARDAEVRALRAEVEGLRTKLDAAEMKVLWHKADAKVANAKHAELVRLVQIAIRKMEYLVRDYPGDKESKKWLVDAAAAVRGDPGHSVESTPASIGGDIEEGT